MLCADPQIPVFPLNYSGDVIGANGICVVVAMKKMLENFCLRIKSVQPVPESANPKVAIAVETNPSGSIAGD